MRALSIGGAGWDYAQYRAGTFRELIYTLWARADWAALQAGKNPFLTDADKIREMNELKELARARYGTE